MYQPFTLFCCFACLPVYCQFSRRRPLSTTPCVLFFLVFSVLYDTTQQYKKYHVTHFSYTLTSVSGIVSFLLPFYLLLVLVLLLSLTPRATSLYIGLNHTIRDIRVCVSLTGRFRLPHTGSRFISKKVRCVYYIFLRRKKTKNILMIVGLPDNHSLAPTATPPGVHYSPP